MTDWIVTTVRIGPQHRDHDGPPDPPLRRAVEGGRLQDLARDGADPGVHRDHHERERAPHHFEQHEQERAVAAVRPGVVAEAEDPVDRAEVRVEQEHPHRRAGDRGRRPRAERGQHQREPGQRPYARQEYGERAADREGAQDAGRREDERGEQHRRELAVREQRRRSCPNPWKLVGCAAADLGLGVLAGRRSGRVGRSGRRAARPGRRGRGPDTATASSRPRRASGGPAPASARAARTASRVAVAGLNPPPRTPRSSSSPRPTTPARRPSCR